MGVAVPQVYVKLVFVDSEDELCGKWMTMHGSPDYAKDG
jgi:hypothetical protein